MAKSLEMRVAARPFRQRLLKLNGAVVAIALAALAQGCAVDSAKSHYILAEKLWTDGNYPAAVAEFDKVVARDSGGKLGQQALFRAGMTQSLYLGQYPEAVQKFRSFTRLAGDTDLAWEANRQIGEILFSRTEQYAAAIEHYKALIKTKPSSPEAPEFLFRIGRSQFFLRQFDSALLYFKDLIAKHPGTSWAERAMLEIGTTQFTRGGQVGTGATAETDFYQEAMDHFERFIRTYPNSPWVAEARFGIAACLEEMDQLDAAYNRYASLKASYPSPHVIEVKLARIKERQALRNR